MSNEATLLRAVCLSPDDDAPRVALAGWLDKHGQADRAEFIRTQLRLATMRPWDEGYDSLHLREQALLGRHGESWLEPIRPFLHPTFDGDADVRTLSVFRRGFVDTVLVDAARFLADPEALFRAAPVTGLNFLLPSSMLPKVLDCDALRRLKRLYFMSWRSRAYGQRQQHLELNPGDFRRIAECPHLKQLRELGLTSQTVPPEEVAALIRSKHLQKLEKLTIAHCAVDSAGFGEIGPGMTLRSLKRLHLNNNYDCGRLQTWRGAAWLRKLRTLDLGRCDLDVQEVASFLGGATWPELEDLGLAMLEGTSSRRGLGKVLARMPRLRSLDLSRRRFSESLGTLSAGGSLEGLENLDLSAGFAPLSSRLVAGDAFPRLRALDLSNNQLEGGLSSLCDVPMAGTLRRLNARQCSSTARDTQAFAKTVRIPLLESLSLGDNTPYTVKTVEVLGATEGFPRLRSLDLRLPGSVKLYQALADTPLVRQLNALTIHGGIVSAGCVAVLTGSPGFQHLSALRFWGSSLNPDNRRRLRDHFGERFLE